MFLAEIDSEDFKRIFRASPGLHLIMAPDLTIVEVSDAHLRATMRERKDVVGRKVFDAFPDNPNDSAATGVNNLKASLERVRKNHETDAMPVQKYDIVRPESEGGGYEERFWSIINAPVFNEKGELIYIYNKVEDVTELMRLREIGAAHQELLFTHNKQLEDSNRRLQDVNKELESFVYSVSHDLRAPLRAIIGFSSIIKENYAKKLDAEGNHLFSVVCNNAQRMNKLIEDLLTFSRMGRQQMTYKTLDTRNLIRETYEEVMKSHPERIIQFSLGTIEPIEGDYALLKQVWMNLILNSVKYTRPVPKPVIKVSSSKNEHEVTYTIVDNGVGFDMHYAHKLFGVFQRLHSEKEFEGTGVGLAIVQQIVRRHGGRVWAEGKVGEGAAFSFALPSSSSSQEPEARSA